MTAGLGGKGANQAVAAVRAGAYVSLVGCVGVDVEGDTALGSLTDLGVDTSRVDRRGETTGRAAVFVADGGSNMIVVIAGANGHLRPADVSGAIAPDDIVLVQLEVPLDVVRQTLLESRSVGATAVLNVSPVVPGAVELVDLADLIVVNESELAALGGDSFAAHRSTIVTLGDRGAVAWIDGGRATVAASDVGAVDTTGAGDCFLGVLAAWMAGGASVQDSIRAGCAAAGLQVTRRGAVAAMPHRADILGVLARS